MQLRDYPVGANSMKWQPIETAPRDGTPIILYIHWCRKVRTGHYSNKSGTITTPRWIVHWTENNKTKVAMEPSHWIPLPEPPEDVIA